MGNLPKVVVSPRAVGRLRSGHVWIYESDVLSKDSLPPGALVEVEDLRGKPQGSAFYSSSSQIKLRMLTREPLAGEPDLLELIRQRLEQAVAYRSRIVRNADAYRLVFSEADGLPGLMVDRYNDVYTLQVLTQAWDQPERRVTILKYLQEF